MQDLLHNRIIVFLYVLQEEEKKESEKVEKSNDKVTVEVTIPVNNQKSSDTSSNSPVRTRSQNKMDFVKPEKLKPVKKTVTFGTVESCEDIFLPLKKLPSKNHAPLVSIIKKKSALKHTEYSTFSSILKPAKLTDLSSKSTSEHQEGYLKKSLNSLSKPTNKFSQFAENRCTSPPPQRNISPDKESSSNKFILPARSAHSSRVIKPNKRFMDGDETVTTSITSVKVLKKPKLKQLVFNNMQDDDTPEEEENNRIITDTKEKPLLAASNLFKDKTASSFSSLNGNSRKLRDLFTYDKGEEYSQDENSNVEGLEKLKVVESHKDERSGHALRKLMDISDVSSTSSTSSGSESEESWDSESPGGSGDDLDRPPLSSPERDKAPSSQLLSGKVIIREARLQLNSPAQSTLGPDGPFSTFSGTSCEFSYILFSVYFIMCLSQPLLYQIVFFIIKVVKTSIYIILYKIFFEKKKIVQKFFIHLFRYCSGTTNIILLYLYKTSTF